MADRVLMVAFHFPPFGGSSGSRRTLAFTRYLPRDGWEPIVLTANVRAYEQIKEQELRDIPDGMLVERAFALDAARHLAIRGRYPSSFAVPDRWKSWRPFARRAGMRLIRSHNPKIIWSTYPIASAHDVAADLQEWSGIPWVADMRDPMVEKDPFSGEEYPRDTAVRSARLKTESRVAARAAHVVFCTDSAREIFLQRFGAKLRSRTSVISNGYDDESFQAAERSLTKLPPTRGFRLVHAGTVYPGDDRGPRSLLEAIGALHTLGKLPSGFRLILRATGYDQQVARLIDQTGTAGCVELAPMLPYKEALQEMLTVEGLLLLQGSASNPAVPAKLYEYLRARRPILALVHHAGETAALLRQLGAGLVAPLDDAGAIQQALAKFLELCANGSAPFASAQAVAALSRAAQTQQLAAVFTRTTNLGTESGMSAPGGGD